jgi:hypothetical protein
MSKNESDNTNELIINAIVKMVGKREFLKTVEKLYGFKKVSVDKPNSKSVVPTESRCVERKK